MRNASHSPLSPSSIPTVLCTAGTRRRADQDLHSDLATKCFFVTTAPAPPTRLGLPSATSTSLTSCGLGFPVRKGRATPSRSSSLVLTCSDVSVPIFSLKRRVVICVSSYNAHCRGSGNVRKESKRETRNPEHNNTASLWIGFPSRSFPLYASFKLQGKVDLESYRGKRGVLGASERER